MVWRWRDITEGKDGPAVVYTELRVASITSAIPFSIIEANALMTTVLASQIKLVVDFIRTYDERIESLSDSLQDAELFKWLLGMRPYMGPLMLAALGDNRNLFNSAEKYKITLALQQ